MMCKRILLRRRFMQDQPERSEVHQTRQAFLQIVNKRGQVAVQSDGFPHLEQGLCRGGSRFEQHSGRG